MNRISQIFATYDRAGESFLLPFAAPHTGVAVRGFSDAILNSPTPSDISNHPDDFDLYLLGQFDSSTGVIIPHPDGKQLIVQGKQIALQRGSGNLV